MNKDLLEGGLIFEKCLFGNFLAQYKKNWGYGEGIVSNPPNTDENKHQGVALAK